MRKELAEIMADVLDMDAGAVAPEMAREGHETWDSLNHLRLVTELEQAFGIKLTMTEIEAIETVADIEALLDAQTTLAG